MEISCEHKNHEVIHQFDYDGCTGLIVWCINCGAWCEHDEYEHDHPDKWQWNEPNAWAGAKVEVDDDLRDLVKWRNGLALDDWGPGLSATIMEKLKGEQRFFKDGKSDRIPEHLMPAYNRFMEMDSNQQYNIVFAILGE